ncbi:MAG: hypothetical protein ACE5HL_01040 [Terriglobia bacterium]
MRLASAVLFLPLLFSASAHARESAPLQPVPGSAPTPKTRYLILCVDGVGYSLVEEMYHRGELPHFQPPSALVASFPSLTSPSLAEMLKPLGAPPSRGYEDYYFDPKENRMRGGFFHRFTRKHFIRGTVRELFDYHPHPVVMTLEYGLPVVGAWLGKRITFGRILKKFERSTKPVYLAYLDSSDPLAHLGGKRFLRGLLRQIDRSIPRLRRRAAGPIEVIVFSDHGNDFRRYRRAPLARALKRRGFRLRKNLPGPRSVVFPRYGLVSSAVLYTQPGGESEVADALRGVEGVAVVAYRDGPGTVVESAAGRARIWRRGSRYCYRPETGDPLALGEILEQLHTRSGRAAEGCASAAAWWQATQEHIYPDPLRRLEFAFEENVAQPASVLVSLKDGYYVGSRLLDFFAWLRATHGNLGREQSLGFALTTAEPLPPFLRGDQLWTALEGQWAPARPPHHRPDSLLTLLWAGHSHLPPP